MTEELNKSRKTYMRDKFFFVQNGESISVSLFKEDSLSLIQATKENRSML